jgi:hypothetical protein
MKHTLIIAYALSAVSMNVHCMGEQQEAIEQYRRQEKKPQPPPYVVPPAFVSSSLASATASLINDVERGINGDSRAAGQGNSNNTRAVCLDRVCLDLQYGKPSETVCRSSACCLWDIRCDADSANECCRCLRQTCCCLCVAGAFAGIVTGLVYWTRAADSCDYNPYQAKCYYDYSSPTPSLPPSYSQSQNYTYMTQLVTALVNKSKKE